MPRDDEMKNWSTLSDGHHRQSESSSSHDFEVSESCLDEKLPQSHEREEEFPRDNAGPIDLERANGDQRTKLSIVVPNLPARYEMSELLGTGGYGQVFKAYDRELQRFVAIKVPRGLKDKTPDSKLRYLEEARTLAKLDHPNIVTIHDVLVNSEGWPCIVSAYIDGVTLGEGMRQGQLSLRKALLIMSQVGKALSYIHCRGIVHRDVKPGNILLNIQGDAILADFGLALHDETLSLSGTCVGTPAYMSPEQARGESHLVDGRSDIFSLGTVLYELLTGKRPFGNGHRRLVFDRLLNQETPPPRQFNPTIPKELERICLRALEKLPSRRYATAADWVEDLESFLKRGGGNVATASLTAKDGSAPTDVERTSNPFANTRADSSKYDINTLSPVIPRGLQAFDRHDKDFFCRLLPGPHDRHRVPESIRFWQRRIDSDEAHDKFRIGVLYGPSGSGKSSFVKAGLLPLLSPTIKTVVIEATRDDTESRLLRGISQKFPTILQSIADQDRDLPSVMRQIRNELNQDGNTRCLIVIDQFEQWLHSKFECEGESLVSALRQCDGQQLQCLLLVRDDFWLMLSRCMEQLDVPIRQNVNAALVDLFAVVHAKNVTQELGAAYGCLPASEADYSPEQKAFVDRALAELTERGKIYPVRLSLFVEMIKNETWSLSTLDRLGGVAGIGLAFLETSFSSELAPVVQRSHATAAKKILRSLLPDSHVEIKGQMRSESELLEISGYAQHPQAFRALMQILEADLRLISPTDPAGTDASEDSQSLSRPGVSYYQLTHDFLVPAIDQWLTRRQQETRRGRAELRLAEYASIWSFKPSIKFAPTWFDWMQIRIWSSSKNWSSIERRMMDLATRHYLTRGGLIGFFVIAIGLVFWGHRQSRDAEAMVSQLQTSSVDQLNGLLDQIVAHKVFTKPALSAVLADSLSDPRLRWRNELAIALVDSDQHAALVEMALSLRPAETAVIAHRLTPIDSSTIARLVPLLSDPSQSDPKKLAVAILLSITSKANDAVEQALKHVQDDLARIIVQRSISDPQDNQILIDSFRPSAASLRQGLTRQAKELKNETARSLANAMTIQLLSEEPSLLLEHLYEANWDHHSSIFAVLDPHLQQLRPQIAIEASRDLLSLPEAADVDRFSRRKSIAVALQHRLGDLNTTWDLLSFSAQPHARHYLIDRLAIFGSTPELILNRYQREADVTIRRALLMVLGTFRDDQVNLTSKSNSIAIVQDAFIHDPDAGIHSISRWLLMRWLEDSWLQNAHSQLRGKPRLGNSNWYVDSEGHTMIVLDARGVRGIERVFAIATDEVTVEQYLRFRPNHTYYHERSPTPNCPVGTLDWFDAVAYCNWLNETQPNAKDIQYPLDNEQLDASAQSEDNLLQSENYRLPTANEWSYAANCLTFSRFYFGDSLETVDEYFHYYETSLVNGTTNQYFPAGTKRPNEFGLFNVYDGIREWCHDGESKRRHVMGLANNNDLFLFPLSRPDDQGKFPNDLVESRNGYYGLRVAKSIVLGEPD